MKQENITMINVDNYIRECKKQGKQVIYWDKKPVKYLRKFARIIYNDSGYHLPHSFPNGEMFAGIKHYKNY